MAEMQLWFFAIAAMIECAALIWALGALIRAKDKNARQKKMMEWVIEHRDDTTPGEFGRELAEAEKAAGERFFADAQNDIEKAAEREEQAA